MLDDQDFTVLKLPLPRCISFLMFLVAAGVVALIVVKIIKPNQKSLVAAATNTTAYNSTLANLTGLSTQVSKLLFLLKSHAPMLSVVSSALVLWLW